MAGKSRFSPAEVQQYIDAHPLETQANIARAFGVVQATISMFIKRHGLRYDKKRFQIYLKIKKSKKADTSVAGLEKSLRQYRQKKSTQRGGNRD